MEKEIFCLYIFVKIELQNILIIKQHIIFLKSKKVEYINSIKFLQKNWLNKC